MSKNVELWWEYFHLKFLQNNYSMRPLQRQGQTTAFFRQIMSNYDIFRHFTAFHDILVRFSAVLAAEIMSDEVFIIKEKTGTMKYNNMMPVLTIWYWLQIHIYS